MSSKATHRVRFPLPKGPVAAPSRAWGEEFDVVIGGGMASKPFVEDGNLAVVDINGPLVQHSHWLLCSYDDIRTRVAAACESGLPTICLRLNSPGGDFAGALELAREIRAMAASYGKKLVAYTDSQCLSAAYAIACAAEELTITDSAFVGSVGVWAALCDETARDKAMGLNVVIVPSGTQKAERNPHVAITENAVSNMQAQVDDMAALFFDLVAEHRGMPRAKVEALQGSEHFGTQAVSLGLADRVVNGWNEYTGKGQVMAKSVQEARASYRATLAKLAADDSDEGKEARAHLSAMDKEDEKKEAKAEDGNGEEKKKDGEEAKSKAEGEPKDEDKDKAKGAADDKEKAKASSGLRIAASSTARELDLAARVHALETERAIEKESAERSALLASRPDFAPEVKASLEGAPISFVRDAVKSWARLASPTQAAANALTPGATRGESQVDQNAPVSGFVGQETQEVFIDRKMGLAKASGGVVRQGNTLELGFLSPAAAQAAVEKLNAEQKGAK